MPFPFLRRERDVRKGIKVPTSIFEFHFRLPLSPSLLLDSSLQKVAEERRERREQNMLSNFSSALEDGRRRAQAMGTALSPLSPPLHSSRYALLPAPASASPPLLPAPLLSCSAPSPAAFSSSSQGTEAAARRAAGAASYCKAPSNNWERQRRVRAHLPEIRLGRNLDLIPPTAASSISSLQLPEVSSPQL